MTDHLTSRHDLGEWQRRTEERLGSLEAQMVRHPASPRASEGQVLTLGLGLIVAALAGWLATLL